MDILSWLSYNYIEIFGALAGIIYVFLEIRQNLWLWPVCIATSAAYIWIFFSGKLYADMGLQVYYLVISILGWYWWVRGTGLRLALTDGGASVAQGSGLISIDPSPGSLLSESGSGEGSIASSPVKFKLQVTRLSLRTGIILGVMFSVLFTVMWLALDKLTDSPVPAADSFITSLSVIATWMLARKIYEHWFLWIIVNSSASILFFTRELYPTVILYIVYCAMSFVGLVEWKKSIPPSQPPPKRGRLSPRGEGV
jgi:nicotinamide mononucleotide transporter